MTCSEPTEPRIPASLTLISGGAQSGKAGAALSSAAVVQVRDANGDALEGVTVTFTPPTGGLVDPTGATTDADGKASAILTLAGPAGVQIFKAAVLALSTEIPQTAVAADPSAISIAGGGIQTDTARAKLGTLSVKVTDTFNNPVGGAAVTWTRSTGTGSLASVAGTTDADGIATNSYTLGTTPGTESVSATVAGLTATFAFTTTVGAPASFAEIAGDNQRALAGAAVSAAPAVKVTDANGNGASGVVVTFTPASGSGTVSPSDGKVTSNASGIATLTSWTLGSSVGGNTLVASATGLSDVTFHATAIATGPSLTVNAGNNQSATVNTAVSTAPSVKFIDANGNPVPGVLVTFAPATGSGSTLPVDGKRTTDANGVATLTSWVLGTTAGAQSLLVSADGVANVTFTATAGAASVAAIAVNAGNNQNATVNTPVSTAPSVKVTDSFGNPVPGAVVTFTAAAGALSPADGRVTTNASGIATLVSWTLGTTSGFQTLTAAVAGASDLTFNATGRAAAPDHLSSSDSPLLVSDATVADASFPLSIVVNVWDTYGNPVSGASVSWTTSSCTGGFTTSGSTTQSNSSGAAPAPALTIMGGTTGGCLVKASLNASTTVFTIIVKPAGSNAWTNGAGNGDFNAPANWSDGAPTSTTQLFVAEVITGKPQLSEDAFAGSVTIQDGAGFDLNSHTLTVAGSVDAGALGITGGTLIVDATSPATLKGMLPTIIIGNPATCGGGSYSLFGNVIATSVTLYCTLDVGSKALTTKGAFSAIGAGALLKMTNSQSTLIVNGASIFAGASETGWLTNGTLRVLGDFTQSSTVSPSSFASSGGHGTFIEGTSAKTVSFASPSNSFFQFLTITSSSTVTLATTVTVNGTFFPSNTGPLVQSGAGKRIVVAGRVEGGAHAILGGVDTLLYTGSTFPKYFNSTAGTGPKVTQLTGSVTLGAAVTVPGGLSVAGTLNLNGNTLTVLDSVVVAGSLSFPSASPANSLVAGLLRIDGGSVTAEAGTLELTGDFIENGSTGTAFQPSVGFLSKFSGTSAQNVSFAHPGTLNSYFRDVTVQNTGAGVVFTTDATFNGLMAIRKNAVATVNGSRTLTLDGGAGINFHDGSLMHVNGIVAPGGLTCQYGIGALIDGSGAFASESTISASTISTACSSATLPAPWFARLADSANGKQIPR